MATYQKLVDEVSIVNTPGKGAGTRRHRQDSREAIYGVGRRFVRAAVRKHASILKQKFPDMNINELIESVQLILQETLNRLVPRAPGVEWFDNERDILIGNSVASIQKLMRQVKQDIRYKARISFEESKSKVNQKLISTAISLGGIDVRDTSHGGDLIKTDLKKGRIVSENQLAPGRAKILRGINKRFGVQVGHAFGPGIGNVAAFTDNAEIFALFTPLEQIELVKLRNMAKQIDARVTIEANLLKRTGREIGKVTVLYIESTAGNTTEGAKLGPIIRRLKVLINKRAEALLTEYGASPSITDRYAKIIESIFLGKRAPKSLTVILKRFKSRRTVKTKVKVYGPKLTPTQKRGPYKTRKREGYNKRDLGQLISFVNSRLHDKIRANMGKGRSKKILNYRTGRFAKSAKVQSLTKSKDKNALDAVVKYQRKPYGVFEPGSGSPLATGPGRSPARIFGISIRQILQEEKIAKLRRVKVTLDG
jgi:hypothetical protein